MSKAIGEIRPEVLRLLAARAGVAAESFGAAAISYALRKRIVGSGAASEEEYVRRLAADPEEFQELLEELVVPETWFFRDAQALRCFARRHGDGNVRRKGVLRVLCVGCSTGEEAYSLAIMLREAGVTPAAFRVVGADVSRRALELAREAKYAERSFRERDETIAALCRRWCDQVDLSWRVRDELRGGVEFVPGNLAQADFLAGDLPFDAIFCRNVLLYFHAEARGTAVRRLHELLLPDGLLFSAPAEARIFSEAGFRSLGSECPCAFRRPDQTVRMTDASPTPRLASAPGLPSELVTHLSSLFSHPTSAPGGMPSEDDTSRAEEASPQSVLHAAERAADEGRLEEADALCGQALSRAPASAAAHYLRGIVRQAQGAPGEAQRSLERALYIDPKHYRALVHMMLLAEQRGDQRAAENYRRRAEEVVAEKA